MKKTIETKLSIAILACFALGGFISGMEAFFFGVSMILTVILAFYGFIKGKWLLTISCIALLLWNFN